MGDYDNIINTAVEDAEKRGEAKGLESGREEGLVEAARNFLAISVLASA